MIMCWDYVYTMTKIGQIKEIVNEAIQRAKFSRIYAVEPSKFWNCKKLAHIVVINWYLQIWSK